MKLSSTISKVSLLRFDNQPASAKHQTKLINKSDVSAKQIDAVIQMVEVVKERGKPLVQALCYDLLSRQQLFLVIPLHFAAQNQTKRNWSLSVNSALDVIIDFMFKMRYYIQTWLYLEIFGKPSRF